MKTEARAKRTGIWAAATVVVLGASALGCFVETHDNPAPGPAVVSTNSTLTVDWSIGGAKDQDVCHQSNADRIVITVMTSDGVDVGTYDASCDAFATSIPLTAGRYAASAVLVDSGGSARTTTVPIAPFTLHGDDTLDIPVDFPPDSFI